jgi:RNA polymerase sporulation-specific sigma factor
MAAAENGTLAVREPSADMHARLITAVQNGDKKAEAELLDKNSGLIWSIVRRFAPRAAPRGIETDDLYQLGSIGFIKAVRNFDLTKGTALSTYAVPKIIGEIRRFLRDDGLIKVSRSAKEAANKLTAARDKFIYTNGSEPTLTELSEITGISPEDIAAADEALTAFDSLLSGGPADAEHGIEDIGSGEAMEYGIVEKIALTEAISRLDPKERAVISLRYRRSFTQQKTAELLGISQVQVSRIESRTLARLKQIMEEI